MAEQEQASGLASSRCLEDVTKEPDAYKLSKQLCPQNGSSLGRKMPFRTTGPTSFLVPIQSLFSRSPEEISPCVSLTLVGLNLPFPEPINGKEEEITTIKLN